MRSDRRGPGKLRRVTGCVCRRFEGQLGSYLPSFPDDVFLTLERQDVPLDLHGCIAHSGRVECKSCGQRYRYDNLLSGCSFEREP
jgi:hypothetical protein